MTVALYASCGDKKEHDVGVMLRNTLLSAFLAIGEPEKVVFRTGNGRPFLSVPACDLSISHSHGVAACALSFPGNMPLPVFPLGDAILIDADEEAFQIGLDIETVEGKKREMAERVSRRNFSAGELEAFTGANDDEAFLDRFLEIWTKKESLIKNTGVGLAGFRKADTAALPTGFSLVTHKVTDFEKPFFLSAALKKRSDNEILTFDDRSDIP